MTRDDSTLRIVFPTIAMCYVQLGDRKRAADFVLEETLAAAEADSEMAYRLATYFAVEGDASEALHWLRRAIYLGTRTIRGSASTRRGAGCWRTRTFRGFSKT